MVVIKFWVFSWVFPFLVVYICYFGFFLFRFSPFLPTLSFVANLMIRCLSYPWRHRGEGCASPALSRYRSPLGCFPRSSLQLVSHSGLFHSPQSNCLATWQNTYWMFLVILAWHAERGSMIESSTCICPWPGHMHCFGNALQHSARTVEWFLCLTVVACSHVIRGLGYSFHSVPCIGHN